MCRRKIQILFKNTQLDFKLFEFRDAFHGRQNANELFYFFSSRLKAHGISQSMGRCLGNICLLGRHLWRVLFICRIFENFAKEFSAQRADVSWIFGLCGLVYFVLGAVGGMLADRWGPRIVCMTGMGFMALGLFLTSLAQNLGTVYLTYGLLVGLGIAFVYTPAIASVQPWFNKRRGLASGIASSGVGAGTLVLPVVVSYLLTAVDWRSALQMMSVGVLLVGLTAGFC